MKKIICIALSAILLTACSSEKKEQQVTGTAETTATTLLTLTEIITTETSFVPEEAEEKQRIEIAVFDPFEDSAAVEDEVYRELSEAVEKISDGRAILKGNVTGLYAKDKIIRSKYIGKLFDKNVVLESGNKDGFEYSFCPFNTEIAETEEELTAFIRNIFTENMYSDEEINEILFAPESIDDQPQYKTVDGVLYIKDHYDGVMYDINFADIIIVSYEENRAEIRAYANGADYLGQIAFMTIVKSEEHGWRLDSLEMKDYWEHEATLLYNGLKLREERFNTILSGGTHPENPKTITVDGESCTETDTGMTLTEMQEFFAEMFSERIQPAKPKTIALREVYTQMYIDEVYFELDGVLYRKDSAPKWYCPEIQIDPYDIGEFSLVSGGIRAAFTIEQDFYDAVADTTFKSKISMTYHNDFLEDSKTCSYVQISSELPIREMAE